MKKKIHNKTFTAVWLSWGSSAPCRRSPPPSPPSENNFDSLFSQINFQLKVFPLEESPALQNYSSLPGGGEVSTGPKSTLGNSFLLCVFEIVGKPALRIPVNSLLTCTVQQWRPKRQSQEKVIDYGGMRISSFASEYILENEKVHATCLTCL